MLKYILSLPVSLYGEDQYHLYFINEEITENQTV